MRIALASARFINRDISFYLGQIDRYIREAKAQGAELVCFGETFLQGFHAMTWDYARDRQRSQRIRSCFRTFAAGQRSWGIDLLFGFVEREGETVAVFSYRGKRCLIALCGDLWDFRERFRLGQDLLLWPVYMNVTPEEWQEHYLSEYAREASLACGDTLLINSVTTMPGEVCSGGCFRFLDGTVKSLLPPGGRGAADSGGMMAERALQESK